MNSKLDRKIVTVFKPALLLIALLLTGLLLQACGSAANNRATTESSGNQGFNEVPTATAIPTNPPTNTSAPNNNSGNNNNQGKRTPTAAVADNPQTSSGPSLTDKLPERTVVRTFTDAQGRTIKLVYGRGSGHNSDYGWAHIYGKHVQGIWYDGGTITTYPKAVNVSDPAQVVTLIGKSLQDSKPDDAGNGRRSYSYAVPNTRYDIFTVVGSDGTIITAYPVPHGSKNNDD